MLINEKLALELKNIIKGVELKERKETYKMIISKEVKDRDGEIIMLDGIDLKQYKKNPVVLRDHSYKTNDIVGKTTKIYIEGNKLIADFVFIDTENGEIAEKLYLAGALKASSIGFIPKERDPNDYTKITKCELLEWSLVAVPCNAEALSLDGKLYEAGIKKGFIKKEVEVIEVPLRNTFKKLLIENDSNYRYSIQTIFANSFVYEKRGNGMEKNLKKSFTIKNGSVKIGDEEIEVEYIGSFINKDMKKDISEIKEILKTLTDDKVKSEDIAKQELEALEKKQTLQAIDNAVGEALKNLKLL